MAKFIHAFGGGNCALAAVVGNYWIATVSDLHALVVLDVASPSAPREVSRLQLAAREKPH